MTRVTRTYAVERVETYEVEMEPADLVKMRALNLTAFHDMLDELDADHEDYQAVDGTWGAESTVQIPPHGLVIEHRGCFIEPVHPSGFWRTQDPGDGKGSFMSDELADVCRIIDLILDGKGKRTERGTWLDL